MRWSCFPRLSRRAEAAPPAICRSITQVGLRGPLAVPAIVLLRLDVVKRCASKQVTEGTKLPVGRTILACTAYTVYTVNVV